MYVITGATGNTGKRITEALLAEGKKVRIISRNAERAQDLADKGAELFIGETTDVEFLKEAFNGATAVYVVIPMDWSSSDYTQLQISHAKAMAEAISYNKVPFAVTLSSQGAHLTKGSGVVLGLHKMEKLFNKIEGANVLHLRPTYFMENTLGMIGLIKQAGIMGSPVKADLPLDVIPTKDIADYAIKRLLKLDFEGKSHQDLLGNRTVSYAEMTRVYGTAIGKPDLQYVEFPYEDFKKSLMENMGASESVANNYVDFIQSLNAGKVLVSKRTDESTTPETIEDFSKTFTQIFNNA